MLAKRLLKWFSAESTLQEINAKLSQCYSLGAYKEVTPT